MRLELEFYDVAEGVPTVPLWPPNGHYGNYGRDDACYGTLILLGFLERATGIEPATFSLGSYLAANQINDLMSLRHKLAQRLLSTLTVRRPSASCLCSA